jgi:hypothetical protein
MRSNIITTNIIVITITIIAFILLTVTKAKAELSATYSINSSTSKELLNWVDKDSIIIVEIDDVVIMPKSKMFSGNGNPYRFFITNLINLSSYVPEYKEVVVSWLSQRKVRLVEDEWKDFVKQAKKKKAKVYGIVSVPFLINNYEKKRALELKELGIIFSKNKKLKNKDVILDKKDGRPVFFYKGIIFAAEQNRDEIIKAFFDKIGGHPKKLLTFDNIKYRVKQIDRSVGIYNMDYFNTHYLAVTEAGDQPIPKIVRFQQRELIENLKWLEDDIAKNSMNKKSLENSILPEQKKGKATIK